MSILALRCFAQEPALEELLALPAVISAGETLELHVLDPQRTPPGGEWTIAGARAAERDGRLRVTIPAALKAGSRIAVHYRSLQGKRILNVGEAKGVRVAPRRAATTPKLTGCVPRGIIGQVVCVCGSYTPESWNGLLIDGKPPGRPVAASSRVVHLRLPEELSPGPHVISGDPAFGFRPEDQVIVMAIAVRGEIGRSALNRGERTTVRLRVTGAEEALPLLIVNHDPSTVRLEGGDRQRTASSGGPVNVVERTLEGRRLGNFRLSYQLQSDPCPCAASEPPPEDPRGLIPARVLALIPQAPPAAMAATAQALAAAFGLGVAEVAGLPSINAGLILFNLPDARDVLLVAALLGADPRVTLAQADFLFPTRAGEISYGRGLIRADRLDASLSGDGVTVAVIDSGADPSLAAERADFTGAKVTSDMHGTMIAGVVREVAPRARILGYKACVPLSPQSVQASCPASALAKALDRAIQQKARVINMSLAGPREKLVVRLVDAAVSAGGAVLAAVGNNGPQAPPGYPAALDNVIAVTAVDANERLFRYATQGPFTDLAAPGVDILGAIPGNHHILLSGTSLAAAYASGAAALVLQRRTNLSPARLQALLEASAKELGPPGKDPQYGSGLLDACRDVSELGGPPLCH